MVFASMEFVEAIQDFYSLRPTELRLTVGEKLRVISRLSDGWIYGENGLGQQGTFPPTHVQSHTTPLNFADGNPQFQDAEVEVLPLIEEPFGEARSTQGNSDELNQSYMYGLVLYAFAGNESEFVYSKVSADKFRYLTVYEGDTVIVKKRFGQEWLWVCRENGSEGFVPSVYVTLIEIEPGTDLERQLSVFPSYAEVEEETVYEEIPDVYRVDLQPSVFGDADQRILPLNATSSFPDDVLNKLTNILIEIFETENSFVRDLTLLSSTVRLHGSEINCKLLNSYLVSVISTSTELLRLLPTREIVLDNIDHAVKQVAHAFLQCETQLKRTYAEYSQNFDKIVRACGNSSAASSPSQTESHEQNLSAPHSIIVRELRQHGMMCFNLETTLLKPIQRVLKYPLLLSQMKSSLVDGQNGLFCSSLTFKCVGDAVEAVQRIAEAVNESKRRQELLDRYRRQSAHKISKHAASNKNIVRSLLPQKFAETVSFEKVARKSSRFLFEVRAGLGLSDLVSQFWSLG